ncbi:MAG: TrmH family RNA methyltransferase [Christensenellales bacterium]|jgi:TrmH family RNA methyltransferase
MAKLAAYDKALDYSYCLGLYPSITLIQARPEAVKRLILHPASAGNEGVLKLRALCAAQNVRAEEAERVLRRESRKDNCFAALVFEKYECALDPDGNHAVLAQISDGGNLGTALRALLGFGIRDVAVIRPCVDIFEPHALRASMGAFFRMRVRVYDDFDQYRAAFPAHALYPFLLDGARPLGAVVREKSAPYSLIFGNEAAGLPAEFASIGTSVYIPHSDEIDSLNLAVAVAIGAYAFTSKGE